MANGTNVKVAACLDAVDAMLSPLIRGTAPDV
jgi:hypothetical protein